MKDIIYAKKVEIKKQIDDENGEGFNKNIDLSGFTIYKGESFISFKIVEINGIATAVIKYIYVINKKDLIKLLGFCINLWSGNAVKFIYFLEHRRNQNYAKKYLKAIGFTIIEENRPGVWKHKYVSNNGFDEDDILEAYI